MAFDLYMRRWLCEVPNQHLGMAVQSERSLVRHAPLLKAVQLTVGSEINLVLQLSAKPHFQLQGRVVSSGVPKIV